MHYSDALRAASLGFLKILLRLSSPLVVTWPPDTTRAAFQQFWGAAFCSCLLVMQQCFLRSLGVFANPAEHICGPSFLKVDRGSGGESHGEEHGNVPGQRIQRRHSLSNEAATSSTR